MSDDFGRFVERGAGAMVVVTAVAREHRAGCLVGFHSQCSIDPPRYAVWISTVNHTHRVAMAAEAVAVHLLGAERRDLAELFGGESGDEVDKFARCAWTPGPSGVPLLDGCDHRLVGRPAARVLGDGDHECLALTVDRVDLGAEPGAFLRLSDVRDLAPGHPA